MFTQDELEIIFHALNFTNMDIYDNEDIEINQLLKKIEVLIK